MLSAHQGQVHSPPSALAEAVASHRATSALPTGGELSQPRAQSYLAAVMPKKKKNRRAMASPEPDDFTPAEELKRLRETNAQLTKRLDKLLEGQARLLAKLEKYENAPTESPPAAASPAAKVKTEEATAAKAATAAKVKAEAATAAKAKEQASAKEQKAKADKKKPATPSTPNGS